MYLLYAIKNVLKKLKILLIFFHSFKNTFLMSCKVCKCLNLVTYRNGGLYGVFYKVKNTIYEIHPYNKTILQYGLLQFSVCFYLNYYMMFSRHFIVICKSDS